MPAVVFEHPDKQAVQIRPRLAVFTVAVGAEEEILNPSLVPLTLTWGHSGRISTLTLKMVLGEGALFGRIRAEDAHTELNHGDEVILRQLFDSGEEVEWFRGNIGQTGMLVQSSPDAEAATLVAYGPEILLANKAVHGQWYKTAAVDDKFIAGTVADADLVRDNVALSDLPCIFNHGGKPNASPALSNTGQPATWRLYDAEELTTYDCRVFEDPGRVVTDPNGSTGNALEAEYWTAYTAALSLLSWFDNGNVIRPYGLYAFKADLDIPIGQVVVEGMTLLEALRAVLVPVGFGFVVHMRLAMAEASTVEGFDIDIFKLHPDTVTAALPKLPEIAFGIRNINHVANQNALVQRVEFLKDSHNTRNDVLVVGDQERAQVTLAFWSDTDTEEVSVDSGNRLYPAWNKTAHDLGDYDDSDEITPDSVEDKPNWVKRYNGGTEFAQYPDVFRTFAWNEDGGLSKYINDGSGNPTIPSTEAFRRKLPLGHTLIANDTGDGFMPAFVEIAIISSGSLDTGSWLRMSEGVRVLKDRAGIRITTERLDVWKPYKSFADLPDHDNNEYAGISFATLLHNTIRGAGDYRMILRVTGTIPKADAITGDKGRQSGRPWPFVSESVINDRRRFKKTAVGDSVAGVDETTRDDQVAIDNYAEAIRDRTEDAVGHGSLTLRQLVYYWKPGDALSATAGRRISFLVDAGGESETDRLPVINQVIWYFAERADKTELVLETPLLKVSQG
jgi:hypothetical protein